jgi:transposase-like protein
MLERGLHVDRGTIFRWVQRYAREFDQRRRTLECSDELEMCAGELLVF